MSVSSDAGPGPSAPPASEPPTTDRAPTTDVSPNSGLHPPIVSRFTTTIPDEGSALVRAAYADNRLRVHGQADDFRFRQSRRDLGSLRIDSFHNSLVTEYDVEPLGCLVVCRVLDRHMDIWTDGRHRRVGPGDVVLLAHPEKAYSTRLEGAGLEIVGVDLDLLAEVTDEPVRDVVDRFHLETFEPLMAWHWERTLHHLTDVVLSDDRLSENPVVLGTSARLVAATLITALDPAGVTPTPTDRTDATNTTVQRAVAYVEEHCDADITVTDIARAAHVSVRALQLAFRRHLDTTPTGYLRRVRLDRAHDDLLAADPASGTSVTDIAMSWGFLNVGRFSAQYRSVHGVPPRWTLNH